MPLTYLNALLLLVILVGIGFVSRPRLHAYWMRTCFVLDLGLLLLVEFSGTSAVEQARQSVVADEEGRWLTLVHVTFAAGGLALWIWQLRIGHLLLRGARERTARHRHIGLTFLLFRLGNVVTAFWVTSG